MGPKECRCDDGKRWQKLEKALIVDLPETTVSKISKSLVQIREEGGAVALGRVLTLVIETDAESAEAAIEAANSASREHPSRIIVLIVGGADSEPRLDAEIRVGGDAGASEVIVLRPYGAAAQYPLSLITGLLLPDAPVVAWWPTITPTNVSETALGRLATRRITDAFTQEDPAAFLDNISKNFSPGDTDFSWTRLTLWRAQLAALLDQPPFLPITGVEIIGASTNPSAQLLAAWMAQQLRCRVALIHRDESEGFKAVYSVKITREGGEIEILRDLSNTATLSQTGQPPKELSLPVRSIRDCLSEDLRRLDNDVAFEKVITVGLPALRNASK
jgi:glucose-6-phosphate dehydrogenase assembly protein OpcA